MKFLAITALLPIGLAAAAATPKQPSYLALMADKFIRKGVRLGNYYDEATLYKGFEAAYKATGNDTLLTWYKNQMDTGVVYENGSISDWDPDWYSLDDYRIGNNLLWWWERTKEEKYKIAADTIRDHLNQHPRTPTGGFWHRAPIYANQMWLDGIFMADVFYAKWTTLFEPKNQSAWDDIILQYDKIEAITRNHTTNLLVHGYDESKVAIWADPETGAAPLVWNRAVGWYFMSLIELIELFPKSHPGYKRLVTYFQTLAQGLKKAQEKEKGGWWLIMSEPYPGMEKNYLEASSAAMFTFGMLRGMRLGLLKEKEFLAPAKKGYEHLIRDFVTRDADGTINFEGTVRVGSLNSNATFEYYTSIPLVQNDPRGGGPFMLASYEWEMRKGH